MVSSAPDQKSFMKWFPKLETRGGVVLGKHGKDFRAMAEFASLVHDDLLVGDIGCIASEPAIEPFNQGFLGTTSGTLELATMVVGNGDVAGLTVEASELFEALGILGGLDDETEVNTEALEASGCFVRIVFASGLLRSLAGRQMAQLSILVARGSFGTPLMNLWALDRRRALQWARR
jgi:hypothetical protein